MLAAARRLLATAAAAAASVGTDVSQQPRSAPANCHLVSAPCPCPLLLTAAHCSPVCSRVLACAASNVAVDNLVERLARQNGKMPVVRVGHPARLLPQVRLADWLTGWLAGWLPIDCCWICTPCLHFCMSHER